MSEEENMPAESAAPAPAPALGVNDLKLMANIIEVVSNRGAIKANEMAAVGTLYNNLMNFLIANGAGPCVPLQIWVLGSQGILALSDWLPTQRKLAITGNQNDHSCEIIQWPCNCH